MNDEIVNIEKKTVIYHIDDWSIEVSVDDAGSVDVAYFEGGVPKEQMGLGTKAVARAVAEAILSMTK